MSEELYYLSATDLLQRYRSKDLSPVEVTQSVMDRIDARNEALNAYCLVDRDSAMQSAKESEARWAKGEPCGSLDGVPTSIKEFMKTKGWPSLYASPVTNPDQAWDEDSPPVARLKEHGAVLLGKTATPEFSWKGVTDSALYGVTRNPWDLDKTPGGSSGGAGAACASGMGALHIGSDAGGSIRIPAAFCGVVGLKPTQNRVPFNPASPSASLSQAGPITRTVEDAALMLNVLSGPDVRDPFALPYTGEDFARNLSAGVKGLKIAMTTGERVLKIDPDVADLITKSAAVFEKAGAHVEEADPGFENPLDIFLSFWQPAAAAYLTGASEEALEKSDRGLVYSAKKGRELTTAQYYAALKARAELAQLMARFHQSYDLLLMPTVSIPPFKAGRGIYGPDDEAYKRSWSPFTFLFNLTNQPAISVPCGLTKDGLPVGLHIIGPVGSEALILQAARVFEAEVPFRAPPEA